jgi:hypothetical protein
MISYGLTMQDKPHEVPEELAKWILERNARYPNVEFKIDCLDRDRSHVDTNESTTKELVVFYGISGLGVTTVTFSYPTQSWSVRTIGGVDSAGNIVSAYADVESVGPLPRDLRAEIAGLPKKTKVVSKRPGSTVVVMDSKENPGTPSETPLRMVPLTADVLWTSELSLSGGEFEYLTEFEPLLYNPATREEAIRLFYKKDWEALRRLKEQSR